MKELGFSEMKKGVEGLYKTKSNACRKCGQYIKAGENYGMIVINGLKTEDGKEFLRQVPWFNGKRPENCFIHEDCYKTLEGETQEKKYFSLYNNKQGKIPSMVSVVNKELADKVKEKLKERGYKINKETARLIYFSRGTIKYKFDKVKENIEMLNRFKDPFAGLFLGLSLNELLNDENRIEKVSNEVNKTMKEVFGM